MREQTAWVAIITAFLLHAQVGCQQTDRPGSSPETLDRPPESAQVVEEFWPDGALRLRKHVLCEPGRSPVDHGTYTRWYQNGHKEYEATYVRGQLQGIETTWHKNGQKHSEQYYDQGQRHGVRRDWDEQGRLRREEHYVKDRPDGTWTIWKPNGNIEWQARFDHGQPLP
jgi:hypothetical protein